MNGSLRSILGLVVLTLCLVLLAGCESQGRPVATVAPARTAPPRPTSVPTRVTARPTALTDAAPATTSSPTPSPSPEPAPVEASSAETCSNAAQFEADVTIPDNTILPPGKAFTKTWRLRNTGTCTWDASYRLIRDVGAELGGPDSLGLPQAVARDEVVDISVQLVAPAAQGVYIGYWQLADAAGRRFGPRIYAQIAVPDPAHGETLPDALVFMYGGGGGDGTCSGFSGTEASPIKFITTDFSWDQYEPVEPRTGEICLGGLSQGIVAHVRLSYSTGKPYTTDFQIGAPAETGVWTGQPMAQIPLAWPLSLSSGVWSVSLEIDGRRFDDTITIRNPGSAGKPVITTEHAGGSPFDAAYCHFRLSPYIYPCPSHTPGETIQVLGTNFPPNQSVPVGIYGAGDVRQLETTHALIHGQLVRTDSQGNFELVFDLSPSAPPGTYIVSSKTDEKPGREPEAYGESRFAVGPGRDEAQPGCDGTAKDLTEPSLWWRQDDKMHGEAVERLQKRLLELGYQLPIYGADGWFGSETDMAVREFQRRNGLVVDGTVGPITWACLKNPQSARGD